MVGQDAFIAVYILASSRNGTLYTGVTSALVARTRPGVRNGWVAVLSALHGLTNSTLHTG